MQKTQIDAFYEDWTFPFGPTETKKNMVTKQFNSILSIRATAFYAEDLSHIDASSLKKIGYSLVVQLPPIPDRLPETEES